MFDTYNLTVDDLVGIYNKSKKEIDKINEFKVTKLVSTVMLKLKDAASIGQRRITFREYLPKEALQILTTKGLTITDRSEDLYNCYEILF